MLCARGGRLSPNPWSATESLETVSSEGRGTAYSRVKPRRELLEVRLFAVWSEHGD